jgi:hypothetical protein
LEYRCKAVEEGLELGRRRKRKERRGEGEKERRRKRRTRRSKQESGAGTQQGELDFHTTCLDVPQECDSPSYTC